MSRVVKPKHTHHVIRIRCDIDNGELLLVGSGRNAYLWAGLDGNYDPVTFSGQQTLRKLANTILQNVPARRRK